MADKLATGAKPTPARLTSCCAPPKLLSLIARVAVRLNGAVGVKVTLMTQLALVARVAGLMGQLLVGAKSPLLVPVVVMLLIVSGALPVFESVTACGVLGVPTCWLGKFTLVGDTLATGARPVPLRLSVAGPPLMLPLTSSVAVRVNGAVGVKITLMVQLAVTARVAGLTGQLLV